MIQPNLSTLKLERSVLRDQILEFKAISKLLVHPKSPNALAGQLIISDIYHLMKRIRTNYNNDGTRYKYIGKTYVEIKQKKSWVFETKQTTIDRKFMTPLVVMKICEVRLIKFINLLSEYYELNDVIKAA